MAEDCVFCKIIQGSLDADFLYRDDQMAAFWDNRPAAPVHILIVPNKHIATINDVRPEDADLLGRMILVAKQLAKEQGVADRGYRLVFNVGSEGGQSVYHIHLHLVGGMRLPIFDR